MNYQQFQPRHPDISTSKYLILGRIGAGLNGEVFEATRQSDGQKVAIKYLNKTDGKSVSRFQNEAQVYQRLNSCLYIVSLLDYSFESPRPYLVMEFCNYKSARNQISLFMNDHCLAVELLLGVAKGIREIHNLGIFHRDLKPDNLLLSGNFWGNYILKIGDAGMSCFIPDPDNLFNRTYTMQGTPNYIDPELFNGKAFSATSDIFSFGVTCYELLTGIRPYPGQKMIHGPEEMRRLIEAMILPTSRNRPNIDQIIAEMELALRPLKVRKAGQNILLGILGGLAAIFAVEAIRDIRKS